MESNNKIDKYKKLISENASDWKKKAIWRKENKLWLRESQRIALSILNQLDNKGMTQAALAIELDVSTQQINKIVKGSENLTLKTICQIGFALGVSLITVNAIENLNSVTLDVESINLPDKSAKSNPTELVELNPEQMEIAA